jgi:restriction system protein
MSNGELGPFFDTSSGMDAVMAQWRELRNHPAYVTSAVTMPIEILGSVESLPATNEPRSNSLAEVAIVVGFAGPDELLRQQLFVPGAKSENGTIVAASLVPYRALLRAIQEDPEFLLHFNWRRFEELTAAMLKDEGFEETILTPASGDLGRDIIGFRGDLRIKVFGQAKLYKPRNIVTAEEVRAFCHVIDDDRSVSKGIITTTSSFAPGSAREFASRIPTRLELQDGKDLLERIRKLAER